VSDIPQDPQQTVQLDPVAREFADASANPPFAYDLDPNENRTRLDRLQQPDAPRPHADVRDLTIDGPEGSVPVRMVRPDASAGSLPVILYLHGGGWCAGSPDSHDRLIRELSVGVGAAVIYPDYTLTPHAQYPTALEECYAAARWVALQGRAEGLDHTRMAVAGDSAGGNMAAALTLLAKQRREFSFVHQVLFYPVTDATFDTSSYHQFATGYFLRRDVMQWYWAQYAPDPVRRKEITASPLRAGIEQLRDLPPALVVTAEADVLRDEGEAYAARLRDAGVDTTSLRCKGTIHGFVMLDALRDTGAAREAMTATFDALRRALRTGPGHQTA
jgi:acetyl esterase